MSNIIEFPNKKAANDNKSLMHYDTIATEAIEAVSHILSLKGYNPVKNRIMLADMGVILNIIVAAMYRADRQIHFLHDPMDEIHQVIKYVKKITGKEIKIKDDELCTDDD